MTSSNYDFFTNINGIMSDLYLCLKNPSDVKSKVIEMSDEGELYRYNDIIEEAEIALSLKDVFQRSDFTADRLSGFVDTFDDFYLRLTRDSKKDNGSFIELRIHDLNGMFKFTPLLLTSDIFRSIDYPRNDREVIVMKERENAILKLLDGFDFSNKCISFRYYCSESDDVMKMNVGWGFVCGYLSLIEENSWFAKIVPREYRNSKLDDWEGFEDFCYGRLSAEKGALKHSVELLEVEKSERFASVFLGLLDAAGEDKFGREDLLLSKAKELANSILWEIKEPERSSANLKNKGGRF